MEPLDHLPCPHLPLSAPSYLMVVAILYHVILPTHHPLHPDTPDIKAGSTGSFPLKTERWSPSLCVVKPLTDKFSSWGKPCFYHKDQGAKENWSSAGEWITFGQEQRDRWREESFHFPDESLSRAQLPACPWVPGVTLLSFKSTFY